MIDNSESEQTNSNTKTLTATNLEKDQDSLPNPDNVLPEEPDSVNVPRSLSAPVSLIKVLCLAFLAAAFVVLIFLNMSYFTLSEIPVSQNTSGIYLILVVLSLIVTGISISVSFWMYYVRSIYLKDGPALVPERWGKILTKLTDVTAYANLQTTKSLSSLLQESDLQSKKSDSLLKSFLTLQEAISIRDKEIERLKQGHDTKVFKKFLMRFVRVSRALRDIYEESIGTDQESKFKYLLRLIEDALEECGVELYAPTLGKDYRDVGPEIADDPKIISTSDPLKDYTIASVEISGFVINGEGELQVIVPAKVSIYRFEQNPEGLN